MSGKNLKLFFIVSNLECDNDKISLNSYTSGLSNLQSLQKIKYEDEKYKDEKFFVELYSYDVNPDLLREKYQDKITKLFKGEISLTERKTFKGIFYLKKNEHSFIYNLNFEKSTIFNKEYPPPRSAKLSNCYQLKAYKGISIKNKDAKVKESLLKALFNDSFALIKPNKEKNNNYDFDFYLELFKLIYANKEIFKLLDAFDLRRVNISHNQKEIKKYSIIMTAFERKIDSLFKSLNEESKTKYKENFYTLLLYFKANYEKENVEALFNNKLIWKYLINILQKYYNYFYIINIPKILINEMLNQTPLSFENMESIFNYISSLEESLSFINININKIYNCCLDKKKKLKYAIQLSRFFITPKENDNYSKIFDELQALIKYEKSNGIFVQLDENLWDMYIHVNSLKNLNNLTIIDNCISLCREINQTLNVEITKAVIDTLIFKINQGEIKNNELLKFLKGNIYFQNNNYARIDYRPTDIFKGFDLDNIDEEFYVLWKEVDIFKIYSFLENMSQKLIVEKIKHMKDFGKLLRLFNFQELILKENKIIGFLYAKFASLIKTYTKESCPNFVKDLALLIYGMDKCKFNFKVFLERIIHKNFPPETINEIYLYITQNYHDISKELANCIINYFINDKNVLKYQKIIDLFKIAPSLNFFKSIFNKIDKFVIKEEELFNENDDIDSFKLLDWIQKEKILDKYKELKETIYFENIYKVQTKIIEHIKTGNIKYNNISAWYIKNLKIFKEKLNIILFNNENNFKDCIQILNGYFSKTKNTLKDINKLNNVLKEFYQNKHKDDIIFLNELENNIKNGFLNEVKKEKTQADLLKLDNILPDLELKNNLKNSLFFIHFYKKNKSNKKNQLKDDDQIFEMAKNDFEKLKLLFEREQFRDIEDSIIKTCYDAVKSLEKNEVEKEIVFLKKYFKLQNLDELKEEQITDQLIALSKKEKIFLTLSGCINFIEETKVKQTEFSEKLRQFHANLTSSITAIKINSNIHELEKYGINVLETKEKNQDYLNILHSLYKKKGAIEFLLKLSTDDCHYLQELCSETENTFLTVAAIQDMEKCSKFMKNLVGDIEKKTDLELITSFIQEIKNSKDLPIVFEQYAYNSRDIQELFSQKLDKSQATLKKIKFISKESLFTLSIFNESENYFSFEGYYIDEEKAQVSILFDELIELSRRAMLTKKLGEEKSEEENKMLEINKNFAKKVNEIMKINSLIKKIAEKGYSENIQLKIEIKNSSSKFLSISDNRKFEDYENCFKYFNKIYSEINRIQNNYYRNNDTKLLRYIYGRLFILLKNYFKNTSNIGIEPFLKYITNDLVESNVVSKREIHYKYDNNLGKGDKYVCLLENINKFLEEYLKNNQLTLESIYQQNIVQKKFNGEFKGLYTYLLDDDKHIQRGEEEHILSWYYFLTEQAPMAQTVLLCNEETTSEEIIAFMHRAILCEYNTVFMVCELKLLTPEKRQILTGLINTLYVGHEKEMKSCLVFVYSDKDLTIVQYLDRLVHKKLEHKDKKNDEKYKSDEKVQIIYSDKAGIGKSTHIKEEVKKNKKTYIHFPFGGEFSRKEVIKRLNNVKIKNPSETVIHLDLYDSKQTELMKNFLYCFLVTKLYGQNENMFYLPKNVEIKIEIPNGFTNFFYKFPILDMFENKYPMSIKKLEDLIVTPQINSNMQIVCNYLKILEEGKINEVDLYIKDISIKNEDLNDDNIKAKEINAESLPQKECQRLIHKYIGIENPTYYQINSFINVLSGQLKRFSMIEQLTARYLIETEEFMNDDSLKNIRYILIDSFIKNTQHFTKGAYNNLLNSDDESYKVEVEQGKYDEIKQEKIAIDVLSVQDKDMISFSKIEPSLIFFHEHEGQEYSIISTCEPNDKEYHNLLKLERFPALIKKEFNKNNEIDEDIEIPEQLNDYRNFTHDMFLKEIKKILDINNRVFKRDKDDELSKGLTSIEEIVGEYVFTADNFIKMILILLRIRENIPTIMMGETGCGKTSLIRKLSELINNGKSNMKILNIHAGIKDQEIVDFLSKNKNKNNQTIIEEAEQLYKEEQKKKLEKLKKGLKYFEKKLWIFLDEINTCNCMGLICELMTKHSCQGESLPKSIVFIAACNPYRKLYNEEALNGLEVKNTKKRVLAYTVNPLPFSLLNFIFNFGRLTPKDEERYINNMIINPIERFYIEDAHVQPERKKNKDDEEEENINKKNFEKQKTIIEYLSNKNDIKEQYEQLKEMAKNAIIKAQNFVRKKYGDSSVSLREIRRFSIFYEFFVHYLRKKRNLFKDVDLNEFSDLNDLYYKNMKDFDIYKNAVNLSVYICYYLRLTNKNYREEFTLEMNKIFGCDFEEIPQREQKYIVNNIEMKEGIAKNRALLENIFSLFVCINAKVPLFIVGKPGCSKSLSVQLLYKSMKGEEFSDNKIFNNLPKLILSPYQGSLASTSEGVKKVFNIARKILENKNKEKEEIISMIYFDEMGLAEHSKNNPLKVIHAELEYDLNEGSKKIAFVGISNWILDASKMNRGIYLSINPPDLKDLIDTSETIAKTYDETLANKNKEFFSNLAETYNNYKEELKNYTKFEDFHGSRDYYHLIKNSMKSLLIKAKNTRNIEIDEQVKQTSGLDSLERNFGGLEIDKENTSLVMIKKEFKKKYENIFVQKKYDVLKRIEENISDKQSRYLLLISKSSVSNYLLKNILSDKKINKDSTFYIGSRFIKDQQSEEYTLKILNKVQLQMEQDKVLLLTDLEPVYPALYDLFNQNFTVMGNKNYARIAIGNSNSAYSLVNDGFKCIILVDQNSINKEEPPFLNRFEKHIISFEYLLPKKIGEEVKSIYNIILDFVKMEINIADNDNENKNEIKNDDNILKLTYDISKLLVNCDEEEIQGIVYSKYKEYENKEEEIIMQDLKNYVLEKIALTLPQDILLYMHFSGFKQKYNDILTNVVEFYNKGEHSSLSNFLKTMENTKNVIYTFTNIDESLLTNISSDINTKMFGKINSNNITDRLISTLSSENDLEGELETFYLENDKKIFVLRFNPEETDIMNYIKFFIENYIKEKNFFEEDNNNKKAFIFTIHMNRIFESDKLDKKKKKYIERNELGETISHLSDFYQIFIDNLNGGDFSLIDIMTYNQEELFRKLLNLNEEFQNHIYEIFSYINYEFVINIPDINKSNYSKNLIEYLLSENDLKEKIINSIIKQNIEKNTENILFEILKNNMMKIEDVDILSVTRKYLSELFKNNFSKFIFKTEKDHYLSPLFYNNLQSYILKKIREKKEIKAKDEIIQKEEGKEKENAIKENNDINEIKEIKQDIKKEELNEKIIDKNQENNENIINKEENKNIIDINKNILIKELESYYLDKLDTSQIKDFNKNMKKNQITLLLGLKLPGMKDIIDKIRLYIKTNISRKYLKNENDLRGLEDEESFIELEGRKKNAFIRNIKSVETELQNNEQLQNLEKYRKDNINDYTQFYDSFLDDYYLIFLSELIPDVKYCYNYLGDYINIIKKMVNLRFENDIDISDDLEIQPKKIISKKILWLESYSQYISVIINIYHEILFYEEDLFNKIDKIIEDKDIQYEISKRSIKGAEKYNSPFFYILESLLKIINSDFDLYKKIDKLKFYDFILLLKTILENASKLYNELFIYSKEISTIEEFLNIQQHLNSVNKGNKENLLEVLKILSDHSRLENLIDNEEPKLKCEELCENMNILYDFLKKNLGDTENFAKLMINIFIEEEKKITNYNYRKSMVEKILNNPKFIPISYQFMSIIINNKEIINIDLYEITDNIQKLKKLIDIDYIELINETDNDILNEIILHILENNFNLYFESLEKANLKDEEQKKYFKRYFKTYYNYFSEHNKINPTYIMFDTTLDIFSDCLNTLEMIYKNSQEKEENKEKINNELLLKLYCISYIKIYLYKCIHFTDSKNNEFLGFKKIMEIIKGNSKNNFRKMIKIYILKIIFHIKDQDFDEFKDYHYTQHGIDFIDEFKDYFSSKKKASLNYYLLPIEKYEDYQNIERKFEDYRYNDFGDGVKEFRDYIEKNGIDDFYTISSNIIISKLSIPNYIDELDYSKYSSFVNNLLDNNLKIPNIKKQLFFLFSKGIEFSEKIKPKILSKNGDKIDQNVFEILLYSMRICLQTSNSEKSDEYFYSHIISDKSKSILAKNCIPGNNLLNDIYVNNYMLIEKHLKTLDHDVGAYVCSCGTYYVCPPCGFPDNKGEDEEQDLCLNANCRKPIGYGPPKDTYTGTHSMVIRPGHYRIFKDEEHRTQEFNEYGDYDEGIPNMLLEQYKKQVIDPILDKSKYGINKVEKIYFQQTNITIRKLSIIGYRLLNYVIYSHIYFAYCLGFISDETLNEYICKDMTIIDMIVTDWNILKDCLQTKGVQTIQIFMNMIFGKLCELLINCKNMDISENRDNFEDEIEKMLEDAYKSYDKYQNEYMEINKNALRLDKNSVKSLVLEIIDENEYDQKNFPFYKLLFMTTYPSIENFKHELIKIPNYEQKYPLLYYSLIVEDDKENIMEKSHKELLKYLPDFNSFINFMINFYSYKISRDEASKMILKEQEIYKNNEGRFKNMYEKFIQIWGEIKDYATKYKCNPDMEPIVLDEDKTLDYFLNDNAVVGKGMYIAAALQNFISWQNNFLEKLIDNLKNGGILHHFVDNMKKTIDVQNATKKDVLNFDEMNNDLSQIIFENSQRNIFKMENKVSYQNYRQFIYDFDSIEKTLGKILLTGKVKFNGENNLKFVTYCLEGFRGNKSSVFIDFINQYKIMDLNKETKQKIYNKEKQKIKNKSNDLQKILFSIQLLIYYLTQDVKSGKEEINSIIKDLPKYVTLTKECISFFEDQDFKVCELTAIYSYFELLCFKTIEENLNEYYKTQIDEKIKENILKEFENGNKKIVNKINLSTACRKLISRYLVSARNDTDLSEKNKLFDYLLREELWSKEDWKNNDLIQNELEFLNYNDIIVGQCYELYNLLGGDENEALKGINLNEKDDKDDDEDEEDDDYEENDKFFRKKRMKF